MTMLFFQKKISTLLNIISKKCNFYWMCTCDWHCTVHNIISHQKTAPHVSNSRKISNFFFITFITKMQLKKLNHVINILSIDFLSGILLYDLYFFKAYSACKTDKPFL